MFLGRVAPLGLGDGGVEAYCREHALPVLMRIPFRRAYAEAIARGQNLIDAAPELVEDFQAMFMAVSRQIDEVRA